jgi:hypothetical protein
MVGCVTEVKGISKGPLFSLLGFFYTIKIECQAIEAIDDFSSQRQGEKGVSFT